VSTRDATVQAPSVVGEEEFARLRSVRHSRPQDIASVLAARARRPLVAGDGRLMIIAADHPARGALAVRGNSMAMASRYDLLQRLALALSRPGVDGVLGTPDIIEDLALLGVLDGKVAVGSMNRGGLRGAVFEMDDRFTGYDVASIAESQLDAAKLLVRVNLNDGATARTLEEAARAVSASARAKIPITSIAIASGLGSTSAYTWLKLPVTDDMERVMEAATLPTLLLGGDPGTAPEATYASWARAVALPGVHGLVVGRTLLYPQDNDVATAVDTAAALVHGL
jgi:hypothetical protein